MQCPCSGGPSNPWLLLAVFAGIWLLFNWVKKLIKSKGVSFMNKAMKIIVVVVLIAAIAGVAMVKKTNKSANTPAADVNKPLATIGNLPRLVDLGADKCIPCKLMAPILEELKTTYNGKLQVDFIDVWKNPDEGKKSGISIIPTQIFYDASGKELYRHEGFFSKEDILAKWKEFGVDLGGPK
jgi:thioredoxin 1